MFLLFSAQRIFLLESFKIVIFFSVTDVKPYSSLVLHYILPKGNNIPQFGNILLELFKEFLFV